MIAELVNYLPYSFFLVCFNLKIDVAMAVLGLAEGHLVEKLSLPQRLLMTLNDFFHELFSQGGCCSPPHSLLLLTILLSLLLEVLRIVEAITFRSGLIAQINSALGDQSAFFFWRVFVLYNYSVTI